MSTNTTNTAYSQQHVAQNTVVDEDDIPAINKRQEESAAAPSSNARSTPMSIQDYLKNQQRK